MSIRLGCIADDYTGASDLANTLTRNGLRTVQTIGIPADNFELRDVDAVVVSLKIRSVPAPQAVSAARAADEWLRARGARHVMYKICSTFDSTDEGNIGPVLDALGGESCVIVTPAFPETGRTVYQGHLFVNGVLLNESPLKDHPLNPMHDANLVRVLARQSSASVGLADWSKVSGGVVALDAHLVALAKVGMGAAICDAISESDLVTLGAVAAAKRFSIGASGLGLGLARALREDATRQANVSKGAALGGLAACLAGSCSQATLAQILQAETTMPVLRLDPAKLIESAEEVTRAVDWAKAQIANGPVLIASSSTPDQVSAVQARFGRDAAGHAIEQGMANIAEQLVRLGVRRLVVAGGETSGAVVDRLNIKAFLLGAEIAPGVPVMQTLGLAHGELAVALKSGNFGGPDFFSDALGHMTA